MTIYGQNYQLAVTTQGPLYPPAEVMDSEGNFVVVGQILRETGTHWGKTIVSSKTPVPPFGQFKPYTIIKELEGATEQSLEQIVLHTLPLPLPANNYPMLFAPEQCPDATQAIRNRLPLHEGHIADYRVTDGRRKLPVITLADWLKASGELKVTLSEDKKRVRFEFRFQNLVPHSVYTVMSLRERDLAVNNPSRPGPLGIPNIIMTDSVGNAEFWAELVDPFPPVSEDSNRIINVVVLFISGQQSYGGAIGLHGLGGDVHAHLKLKNPGFSEFTTQA